MSFFINPNGTAMRIRNPGGSMFSFPPVRRTGTEPVNTVAPQLTGSQTIGSTLTAGSGTWTDADTVVRDLMRDDEVLVAGIPSGYTYVITAADDQKVLWVREIGTSSWGSITAPSQSVLALYTAPTAVGSITAKSYTQGTGPQSVATASNFSGSNLQFSIVSGPASVDELSGVVVIGTDAVVSTTSIVVRASNSGGSVTQTFSVTVAAGTAPDTGPTKIPLADITQTIREDFENAGKYTWHWDLANVPAGLTRLWWRGTPHVDGSGPGSGYHPAVPHPTIADRWVARVITSTTDATPTTKNWLWDNRIGEELTFHLIYTTDALGTSAFDATWSAPSDPIVQVQQLWQDDEPPAPTITNIKRMPVADESEWAAPGYIPADGMQQWHALDWCLGDPDVIYGMQDSGALWLSRDHGRNWVVPRKFGLNAYQGLGVAVDPVDPNRVICNMGGSYASNKPYQGLYASTDGGATFGPRIAAGVTDSRRGTHSAIAYAPGSIGATRAEKWLAIVDGRSEGGSATNIKIVASTNGWGSWTERSTWSQVSFGTSCWMVGDPTNDNTFYVACGAGLVKITNAFTGTLTKTVLSGSNGLPASGIAGKPYISANGQTMIIGCGSGIYKTTNAGSSWSKVGTETGFAKLQVSPYNPNHMILLYSQQDTQQRPKYSTNGGTSFTSTSSANVEKRPGLSYTPTMMYNYAHVAFHSTAGQAWLCGRQTTLPQAANHYRTSDYGVNWSLSMVGFNGCNVSNKGQSPSMFSNQDKNLFGIAMLDLGPRMTTTGGKWFHPRGLTSSMAGGSVSSHGVAVHPTPSRNTIFCAVGENSAVLWASYDRGATWTEHHSMGKGYTIIVDKDDPSIVYAGRHKSTNYGVSFSAMSNLPTDCTVVDANMTGSGTAIWAMDMNGTRKKIYRSTNKGSTWTLVVTLSWTNTTDGGVWGPIACHPSDPKYIWTSGPNDYTLRRHDVVAGTSTDFNMFGSGGSQPGSWSTSPQMSRIAIDRRYPDVMYAGSDHGGIPRVFRTTNGGSGAWEMLEDIPMSMNLNCINVHPLTGEVLIGGSNGSWLMAPPYAQSGKLMDALPYGPGLE